MAPEVFGMFGLIEWLIFVFIGTNMTLAGACLLHRGVKKLDISDE
ncbi:MAG: hypothetical protein AAFW68_05925 [Pseudomonadota bacterium]